MHLTPCMCCLEICGQVLLDNIFLLTSFYLDQLDGTMLFESAGGMPSDSVVGLQE